MSYRNESLSFPIVLTGITNVVNSSGSRDVRVQLVKEGEMVVFSWPGFQGVLNQTGHPSIEVQQSFPFMPNYNLVFPIVLSHRGIRKHGLLSVESKDSMQVVQIKFFLNIEQNGIGLNAADSVEIYPSTVSWISS